MLSHLHIKDFAIIDDMNVDFHEGLNIITGETGAGKSIIIEAVNLALGSRADTAFVRSGKDKSLIELVVDDCPEELCEFLEAEGIELDDRQLIIRREISSVGKSLCKINGSIVPVSFLNSTCKLIADVHGQYDHQYLLDTGSHISLLDLYAHTDISDVKQEVSELYTRYTDLQKKLAKLEADSQDFNNKRDFAIFQLEEIRGADLKLGEDENLQANIKLMQNSEKIFTDLSQAYNNIYENSRSAFDLLSISKSHLESSSEYSEDLMDILNSFNEAYYILEDLKSAIRKSRDQISFSEEDLNNSISRLELITSLKRKYGSSIEKILEFKSELENQLNLAESSSETRVELEGELERVKNELVTNSEKLSTLRKLSASKLENEISCQLKELSFNSSEFKISFTELPFTSSGTDGVEFLISTNKGEPLKPLAKIASGGEMSRIMLAFKKILSDYDNINTLVFDEIDTGISGITASVVGRKLKEIGMTRQILCITHLPQIAACGSVNYKIVKNSDESATYTSLIELNEEEKVLEIARLLGGINVTASTLTSAKELIAASI